LSSLTNAIRLLFEGLVAVAVAARLTQAAGLRGLAVQVGHTRL